MNELVRWGVVIGVAASISIAGCGGGRARGGAAGTAGAAGAAGPNAPVRFLVVRDEQTVRFMEATPDGLRETRRVKTPMKIAKMEWAGSDVVAILHEDLSRAGRITARGYEPFAEIPEATWGIKPDEHRDTTAEEWMLVTSDDGTIWQSRCAVSVDGDGEEICTAYVHARLHPGPVTITRELDTGFGSLSHELPTIAPSSAIRAEIVEHGGWSALRCTEGTRTLNFPESDDGLGLQRDIDWLSTTPPIFAVVQRLDGHDHASRTVVFEGCTRSVRFGALDTDLTLEAGPNGLFAIVGATNTSVRQRERELGMLEGATLLRWAPVPITD